MPYSEGYRNPYYDSKKTFCYNLKKEHTLTVTGKASIFEKANIVNLHVGINSQDKNLTLCMKNNCLKVSEILSALEAFGLPQENITVDHYYFHPQYEYLNGTRIFKAYIVTNNLKITFKLSKNFLDILELALKEDKASITSVSFGISNYSELYNKALGLAAESAKKKALSISKAIGINLREAPFHIIEKSQEEGCEVQKFTPLILSSKVSLLPAEIEVLAKLNMVFSY